MKPAVCLSVQFDQLVCTCHGEFDLCAYPVLRAVGCQINRDDHPRIVLDLSDVGFLDCAAIRLLAGILRTGAESGKTTLVVCPDGFLCRLLTLTGFTTEFPVVSVGVAVAGESPGRGLRVVNPTGDTL